MITILNNLPSNMVGFKASGEVTKEDFDRVLLPEVKRLTNKTDKLNYLLVLDTPIENFTIGAWMKDAWLGIKNIAKWNRGAIVSDSKNIKRFTDGFSYAVPGEFKGFFHEDLQQAIEWVASEK